jgi:hypothetical protein
MANLSQARAAKAHAFSQIRASTGIRPTSVGIIGSETDGYALKILLPRRPSGDMPTTLGAVPLEFHVVVSKPALLSGARVPSWLAKHRALKQSQER